MMLLEMAMAGYGDRVAFVDAQSEQSITYQGLFEAAANDANDLRASRAARFAILDVSNLAVPIGLFASSWAGMPYVPISYRLTDDEIDGLVERVKPAYLVTDADHIEHFHTDSIVRRHSRSEFLALARNGSANPAEPWSMDGDETAALLFTSGTTGAPKAAVLRQKHLVSYIAVLSSVYSGRRAVQLANFTPEAWIELARAEKVTTAFVVPTMLRRIVEALEGEHHARMPHLQSLSYGGGKMPLPVIERAMALFPDTDFTNAYGLTETSSTITVLGPDAHR